MVVYKRVPVNAVYKRLMLVVCFALMVIEYESGTLFLWPLDHSCAKPANLSIFSELFVDSKSQPIDLDAVQRNLFDATPEDSFTLARAASMGINYDDVARCFEYSMDYSDDNQPVFNMDNLEPCRYGLHFEVLAPKVSIIGHYNLACQRQWLKVLLPQSYAFGLLAGLMVTYFVWFQRGACGRQPAKQLHAKCNNLATWTGANLAGFVVLYLITLMLNQCFLDNSHKDTAGTSDGGQQGQRYLLFVACVFLRSAIVSSIMCRIAIKWKATSMSHALDNHHRACFLAFASALVALKVCFVPVALKLFDSWSGLNLFLTLSQAILLALTIMFELMQTRSRFHTLLDSSPSPFHARTRIQAQTSRLQQAPPSAPPNGHHVAGRELGGQQLAECTDAGAGRAGKQTNGPRLLLEIDETRDTTRAAWANHWGAQLQRIEPAFRTCEFCSAKDERIFGIMNQPNRLARQPSPIAWSGVRVGHTSAGGRQLQPEFSDQETRQCAELDESASPERSPYDVSSGAYQSTTIPLDQCPDHDDGGGVDDDDHVTAGAKATGIRMKIDKSAGLMAPSRVLSEPASGQSVAIGNEPLPIASGPMPTTSIGTKPNFFTGFRNNPASRTIEHNSSLFELSIGKWPLMSKLSVLTFCLAFNYFLVQTIPNHKLLHSETISSLMARKTNHRIVESAAAAASEAHQNNTAGRKSWSRDEMSGKIAESLAGNSADKAVKFVYNPVLVTKDPFRPPTRAPRPLLAPNPTMRNNATHLNSISGVEQTDADSHQRQLDGVVSIRTMAQVGPKYELDSGASESAFRDEQQRVNNGAPPTKAPSMNMASQSKSNESAMSSKSSSLAPVAFKQLELQGADESHTKYRYSTEQIWPTHREAAPNGSKVTTWDNSFKTSSRLFNYNSVDYASQTVDRLVRSRNPLEIGWVMLNLNGWPVELLVILLHTSRLTNFGSTYFKLSRLFSLVVGGSKLLVFEWLLIALVPKQNHLLEMEWLLASLLLVARFATSLMLYSHLHMLLKLGARLDSGKLITATVETTPLVLAALALALWAPIFEKISLILIPLLVVASNLIVYYLARAIDDKFKGLLCPMMFE